MAQSGNLSEQTEILSQVLSLIEAFRAFDADNDGSISAAELGGILSTLGHTVSEQDLNVMMQQGDRNGDRLLSMEEFLEMTTDKMELGNLSNFLATAFETLGANGNDDVTGEELYESLENTGSGLSLENCQNIIAAMDEDGDGVVSFEVLKLIVNSLS